jgi:hypothetical protein
MFVVVFTRESPPVLLTRYFCFVGGALLALLLFVGWYWPGAPAQPSDADASAVANSIRIRSAQRWPDKVVIDTSVPTIVPPPAPPAPILAQAQPAPAEKADVPAKHSPADAHAEIRREPSAPSHKRQTQIRVARHRYPRQPMGSSTWASAGPPMAPSWPFGW